MAVARRRPPYAGTALCLVTALALAGCGGDGTTPELGATRETPPGGTAVADLEATSDALVEAVRSFAEDQDGLPRTVRLRTLSDGEGRFALEARLRSDAGVATVDDDRLRPGVELGWYVPFVPPDFAGVQAPGTAGFGFCLVNRSGRRVTAGGTAPDSSTATVDPGGAGDCGEPPTDPAG
ncbi:hypothetical protein ASG49_08685 [Marmoricola sp. Leaf446]|uniref:hypothetical protein n=1 Tax=Marmoricola sp. Leaf446 TaxID=1736379 RepID=UPI0006FBAEC1|nr:hypothetical protein [Marmoricola sp. Leaf446]KQT92045.1 hypothetical protein ASG49_08685 [Marmoricola sp. Leaf446]